MALNLEKMGIRIGYPGEDGRNGREIENSEFWNLKPGDTFEFIDSNGRSRSGEALVLLQLDYENGNGAKPEEAYVMFSQNEFTAERDGDKANPERNVTLISIIYPWGQKPDAFPVKGLASVQNLIQRMEIIADNGPVNMTLPEKIGALVEDLNENGNGRVA